MSVHLPVLFRNQTKWKEDTKITSQHREQLANAQKVEGALFHPTHNNNSTSLLSPHQPHHSSGGTGAGSSQRMNRSMIMNKPTNDCSTNQDV